MTSNGRVLSPGRGKAAAVMAMRPVRALCTPFTVAWALIGADALFLAAIVFGAFA